MSLLLLRNAIRSSSSKNLHTLKNGLTSYLRQSYLSTEAEADQSPPLQDSSSSSIDPFLQTPAQGGGAVYGKLLGITKHTLKTDIINLLQGSNLTPHHLKFTYNSYNPVSIMIQFPSQHAFDNAFKVIAKKGRLYGLQKADRSQWDRIMPYDEKTVLLEGIPRNAFPEDVECFLCGCDFDSSSIRLFMRQWSPEPMRAAVVRFNTRTEAMNAFVTKNHGFCLNNQISMRVLQ